MAIDPGIALSLALAALVCLLGPLALGFWWQQRTGTSFAVFGWGAVVFFVSQVVLRFPWQIPLSRAVASNDRSWMVPFLIFSAVTAGVFEEIGRSVGYRTVLRNQYTRSVGVMYGLGHGACESILLAGVPLAGLLIAWIMAAHGHIPEGTALQAIRQQTQAVGAGGAQLAVLERASAIASHVGLSLIVLQAFTRGGRKWVVLAILLHAAIDMTAGLLLEEYHILAITGEIIVAVLALGILGLGLRLSAPTAPPSDSPLPPR
jgi:uncharacterized membrane protein YhfC